LRDAGIADALAGAAGSAGAKAAEAADGRPARAPPPEVLAALEDDLNTPEALAALFALARAANKSTEAGERLAIARSLRAGASLLGLLGRPPQSWFSARPLGSDVGSDITSADIDALVARREALRRERKFAEADAIRDHLAGAGIVIEDVAGGARWRRAH
jgi:cysteinyl-tRNA synthetase